MAKQFLESTVEPRCPTEMHDSQPSVKSVSRPQLSRRVTRTLVRVNTPSDDSGSVDSGLGQGMEMALTLCVFMGLGWLADRALGTSPVFMVVLVVFAMIGQSARMWFTYDARMRQLEQRRRQQGTVNKGHVSDSSTHGANALDNEDEAGRNP